MYKNKIGEKSVYSRTFLQGVYRVNYKFEKSNHLQVHVVVGIDCMHCWIKLKCIFPQNGCYKTIFN